MTQSVAYLSKDARTCE